jgi:hypothetical protein
VSGKPLPERGHDTPEQLYGRLFGGAGNGGDPGSPPAGRRVLAVIWATVDRDRILARLLSTGENLADDPLLGASVTLVRPADGDPIAILEPVTEGRLAASLARHDEGPAGEYVEAPIPLDALGAAATAAGLAVSRAADGPFGRAVLVLSPAVVAPHFVLVERPPGTIGR